MRFDHIHGDIRFVWHVWHFFERHVGDIHLG
jgi:hypothetical protein